MVDSLSLRMTRFQVRDNPDMLVEPGRISARNGDIETEIPLWTDPHGKNHYGRKAYHNGKLLNVTIDDKGARVKFSLPKVYTGNLNIEPLTKVESNIAFDKVQKILSDIGIDTDIREGIISRVDLFKNGIMENPVPYYLRLLGGLPEGTRMKKRDYGETVLFHNTQREVCLYDKVQELEKRGVVSKQHSGNILRCELRLIRGRVVKAETLIEANHLIGQWDSLEDVYLRNVNNTLSRGNTDVKSFAVEIERLEYLQSKFPGRNSFQKVVSSYGLAKLFDAFGGNEDVFFETIKSKFGINAAYRATKMFQEIGFEFGTWDTGKISGAELWGELKQKLLTKVA